MSYNQLAPITNAEIAAITAGSEIEDAAEAGRQGMYKMCARISRRRQSLGFSDADIFEGLSMGCDMTDISFYTFKVLEYLSRYTTRYGMAVVLVAGVWTVLSKIASIAGPLFSLVFGGSDSKEKDCYAKDRVVRDTWFTSGANQADLIANLLSTFSMLLPPGLMTAVNQIIGTASNNTPAPSSQGGKGSLAQQILSTLGGQANAGGGNQTVSMPSDPSEAEKILEWIKVAERLGGLGSLTAQSDRTMRDRTVRDRTVRDGSSRGIRPGSMGIARRSI